MVREFRLSPEFLSPYQTKKPDFGPLGEVTFLRTYSRPTEDGDQEKWWECCARVVEGVFSIQKKHCGSLKLPWNNQKAQRSAQEMYSRMFDMKWLPPGRGLWAMGTEIIEKTGSAALNNCAFVTTKDIGSSFAEPFAWAMEMAMYGVGIGFDTRGAGKVTFKVPKMKSAFDPFVVPDTREGWVEAVSLVLNAFVGEGMLPVFDYSQIRAAGEPLKTFGGISSGSGPLSDLITELTVWLSTKAGEKIDSQTIVDIMDLMAKAVISGNIRRTALIALGEPDDEGFTSMKDPERYKWKLLSHRWASNNSVIASKGMDYSKLAESTSKNGEPGFIWLRNCQKYGRMNEKDQMWEDYGVMGVNPCSEQTLWPWELCCLSESFPSRHDSLEDYKKTLKYAYLYGKTVTLIPTQSEHTNAVMMRNRRIGMSMSGIVEAMQKVGRREFLKWCDEGYSYVRELDKVYSDWLCIPKSIKVTTVKPSGSVSLLPGVTPGVHFPHSEYYYRTIRMSDTSPLVKKLEKAGYRIEKDVVSPLTVVVYFAIHEKNFDRAKSEVSMWEQLELAAQMQHYWSDNSVSVTVTFDQETEGKDIAKALELYETRLKSVSFLPLEDHQYQQAPYQKITKEEYEEYTKKLKKVNLSGLEHEAQDMFCDGFACEIKR